MIDPQSLNELRDAISNQVAGDRALLDQLRKEVLPLKAAVHRIQPRGTTSISLVGTDGGNNQIQFDPFLVQLVRVVDSSNNEYCCNRNVRIFPHRASALPLLGALGRGLG